MTEFNKAEALEYLGVSERTLERYVNKNKIGVRYVNSPRGKQPVFEEADLARFKAEQQQSNYHPSVVTEQRQSVINESVLKQNALSFAPTYALNEDERAAIQVWVEIATQTQLLEIINHKLLLNLDEAAAVSGLARSHLEKAAKSGELNARKIGRGWKLRGEDLSDYIDGLFGGNKRGSG
ncbi:helix-turn-helix domain-containing protein [aff. Roholtiella sp. LEGE 12411]|uniref:helix-turn-helix domain-containing protein n=1 Tax=aff. Roholtiella sp. LEGE 12411 TaxID=1828822 RepID=UPI00187F1425|nr:helix-turn-helix domain-containing protein [aff. Roholtiella sp. LEGE 12411]MBE9038325.1 helix-turn-helix domain-containing protein [aff. Roholtiella sp. LEGE 12411]